ncbi:MAG: regulatory protein RecX [Chloroflexota bacterium]
MVARARSSQERREAAARRRARRAEIEDASIVMEAAATFLAVRQRSVEETRRRLNHLGYPTALCDEVVDRLIELAYLDDRAFPKAWVGSRDRTRPRRQPALRRELQSKGVPDDTIHEVVAERAEAAARSAALDADDGQGRAADAEEIVARRLVERRSAVLGRELDPRRRRQKAYALLARSGFSPDVCRDVAAGVAAAPAD